MPAQSKQRKFPLRFKEKSNYVSIITITLAFTYYLIRLLTQQNNSPTHAFTTLAIVTLLFILIQIIAQSILASTAPQDANKQPDALELSASLKAHKVAYVVLVSGVFTSLILSFLSISGFWLFQSVLLFFVLAEVSKYAFENVYLWRAVRRNRRAD